MSQSRQLAAIMFTDIVEYTALMVKDEQKAFELLKKNCRVRVLGRSGTLIASYFESSMKQLFEHQGPGLIEIATDLKLI